MGCAISVISDKRWAGMTRSWAFVAWILHQVGLWYAIGNRVPLWAALHATSRQPYGFRELPSPAQTRVIQARYRGSHR